MRVFLTGATGGIGSAVMEALLVNHHNVAYLARENSNDFRIQEYKNQAIAIDGDLLDIPSIEDSFAYFKPEVIIHLGWMGVDKKEKSNNSQVHNLAAAVELLRLAAKYQVKQFIGLGSEAEYGVHNRKINEQAVTLPLTNYAIAKLATGLTCQKICQDQDIHFTWLRLFSSYGPKDRPGSLMSLLIQNLLLNQDMPLSECVQIWDYVYVKDIARLILKIVETPQEEGFYNLGGGQAQPLKNIIQKISSLLPSQAQLQFGKIPYGPNQNMHVEADISKLNRVYGWKPEVSLEQGLLETIQWHKSPQKSHS